MLDRPDLPEGVRAMMAERPDEIALSVLSGWEIATKTAIGTV
jgi:PIN domain nuclease of toxin-antitoxin system